MRVEPSSSDEGERLAAGQEDKTIDSGCISICSKGTLSVR
jgi:hypothetical protein